MSLIRYGVSFTDFTGLFDLLDEEVAKEMSTEDIEVLHVWLSKNPKSQSFGRMIVICKPKNPIIYEGINIEYFELTAMVHRPHLKSPRRANNIDNLEIIELTDVEKDGLRHVWKTNGHTSFGNEAFWAYTPTNTLTGENLVVRILMEQVIKVSRSRNFIGELKKYDKEYLKYHP